MAHPDNEKGFTLLEVAVALMVFIAISGAIFGIISAVGRSWQRQKTDMDLVRGLSWAMEFVTGEIRHAGNFSQAGSDRIRFELDTDGNNSPDTAVWYWRGDSSSDAAALGNSSFLYRGIGSDINQAYANRQELANFISDNPSASSIFNYSSGVLKIMLTASQNNQIYTLSAASRIRN